MGLLQGADPHHPCLRFFRSKVAGFARFCKIVDERLVAPKILFFFQRGYFIHSNIGIFAMDVSNCLPFCQRRDLFVDLSLPPISRKMGASL